MGCFQKHLFLCGVFILLSGCAAVGPKLGVSPAEWKRYTPEQRSQLSAAYQQTQAIKKEQPVQAGDSRVQVKIQGGRASMPPDFNLQTYQPLTFQIKEGECHRAFSLISELNPRQKTILSACYSGRILYLDSSPHEPSRAYGSILLRSMPMWKREFTYPGVSSFGLARLTDVNISIKELSER